MNISFGAFESEKDSRTIKIDDISLSSKPLFSGGIVYNSYDIEDQRRVGICTAISLTQNRSKTTGRKYSADFQYLLQKKYYDSGWFEGSSILHSLKVGKRFGFLPIEHWTYTTESDRDLSYDKYIEKLESISDIEIERLISLCIDKIQGYASIDVTDSQKIASEISNSKSGILCRYSVGDEWHTSITGVWSMDSKDINPLRAPKKIKAGHAIIMSSFDYSKETMQVLANTWGIKWNKEGCADINWNNYKMTEAWSILEEAPVIKVRFNYDLEYGMTSPDVKQLQIFLNKDEETKLSSSGPGSSGQETKFFGLLTRNAVRKFQRIHGIDIVGRVGPITRAKINSLLINK
jgi:hypothetical protein